MTRRANALYVKRTCSCCRRKYEGLKKPAGIVGRVDRCLRCRLYCRPHMGVVNHGP